jgi:hypothetical protein
MQFEVNTTILDWLSILFTSECMAKSVIGSPVKPGIYGVETKLISTDEKLENNQLIRRHE